MLCVQELARGLSKRDTHTKRERERERERVCVKVEKATSITATKTKTINNKVVAVVRGEDDNEIDIEHYFGLVVR
jgi:hypothetical protein